ncbi:hypothetical protein GCK72_023168 [Caenorhabditis remanei]|uniref:Uncharacterized protein n=1 Tax=Caenorhabditis remanei TaxID=31234 RepID=A0A6A5FW80_CAERE|nr:hypothetical protein GCK72_023168 [Caenorhabditis remanei]KAF1746711.1 hypothetical protein GCK72_023168 [Caenorhabditis remanei]
MSEENYRSSITSRPTFNRTVTSSTQNFGSPGSGNRLIKIITETSSSTMTGGPSSFGQSAASTIRDNREREKKEIMELNDRLASYIEKVRFLEAQNRKLEADVKMLHGRSGKSTVSVKIMYESEITEAHKVVKESSVSKEQSEKEITKLQEQVKEYRDKLEEAQNGRTEDRLKIDELLVTYSELEAEINLLKRRIALLEEEISHLRKENAWLQAELQRARVQLDQETLLRIDNQNRVKTLLEEIDFMKRGFDSELKDLQAMAVRDTTSENREFFKNELANAIRDIRAEYEKMMNGNKNEMESWYQMRVQEINTQSNRQNAENNYHKDEVKRVKSQLTDLRGKVSDLESRIMQNNKRKEDLTNLADDEGLAYEAALNDKDAHIRKLREDCQSLMVELQMLLDTKQTLDGEIKVYRAIIEGVDNPGLAQLVEKVVRTTAINEVADTETMRVVKGEHSNRTSYQRSAKGSIIIKESSPEGKYVVIENTNRNKEEPLGDWKLKRKIDGKREIIFTFPSDYVLQASQSVKIFARGHGTENPPESLVFEGDDTFGVGSNVQTILYNSNGEKRATEYQRQSQQTTTTA